MYSVHHCNPYGYYHSNNNSRSNHRLQQWWGRCRTTWKWWRWRKWGRTTRRWWTAWWRRTTWWHSRSRTWPSRERSQIGGKSPSSIRWRTQQDTIVPVTMGDLLGSQLHRRHHGTTIYKGVVLPLVYPRTGSPRLGHT